MIHHHEVVKHPNGGYAVVPCLDNDDIPRATSKSRRFNDRFEALEYASKLSVSNSARYSREVLTELGRK